MTETMLTRMARAMAYAWYLDDFEPEEAKKASDSEWSEFVPIARAALEAIYEPSEAMLEGASQNGPDTNNGPFSYDDARNVWRDMTAAILQGEA